MPILKSVCFARRYNVRAYGGPFYMVGVATTVQHASRFAIHSEGMEVHSYDRHVGMHSAEFKYGVIYS